MENKEQASSFGHRWAVRIGIEMVTATMLGLGMGYLLDRWLGTRPWLLLLFFLFGVFAGFMNLYRNIRLDRLHNGRGDSHDSTG